MIMINPREVSASVIMSIAKDGEYNNIALRRALKQNGAMSDKDKAFVTETVNGTLRNIFYIDYIINLFSTVKTEKIKPWILAVLRVSVYQMIFMKVPERAAIDEGVELVKNKGFGKLTGYTNGVLRNISRNFDNIMLPDKDKDQNMYLSIKYSHPLWLIKMWLSQYDFEFVEELCKANLKTPRVTISVNILKISKSELKEKLIKEGIEAEDMRYIKNSLSLKKVSDMTKLKTFNEGLFHVQDESSAIAIEVLAPTAGETILDICAAPGGKSFLIAEKMGNKGKVISRDIFQHKLDLMKDTADRLGISIINTELKDATYHYEDDENKYDRVLIDAPCSGFGLLRKKADIRLRRTGDDIDSLVKIQRQILETSSKYVKKDGILVYSTCTICKKENLGNVKWFLDSFQYELEDISQLLHKDLVNEGPTQGYVNLFPNVHETDGFFIARFRRKG